VTAYYTNQSPLSKAVLWTPLAEAGLVPWESLKILQGKGWTRAIKMQYDALAKRMETARGLQIFRELA
jgi:hypothetical protein